MDEKIHDYVREISTQMATIQKCINRMQVSFQKLMDREYELIQDARGDITKL